MFLYESINKVDNRKSNLRFANKSLNAMNSCLSSANTSGYKGVYFQKTSNRWIA